MTAIAIIRRSDLRRMADVAKAEGVTIWVEINGRRVGVSPNIPDINSQKPIVGPDEIDL